MPVPTTTAELLDVLRKSNLVEPAKLAAFLAVHSGGFASPKAVCQALQAEGTLTPFQIEQVLRGKYRGFFLGKYKILDRIGLGGMGQVFLAEHASMRRRTAIKVLPPERARNPFSRERFCREARASGQLDHPNLVRAFDFDGESEVMYLVMEYVEGVSFHDLVHRAGPLDADRIGHYLWQAAHGLAYLHASGLIHRDIKPANLLVDRQGVVKILDLGLVRTEEEQDALTRGEGVTMLGTADYFAPEQALDCSSVDVRADLYSLGATAYFLATKKPPFEAEQLAQKLIAHQMKAVVPLTVVRPGFPQDLSDIVLKLLAKKPADRYQNPTELLEALASYGRNPPPPPGSDEIPLSALASAGTYSAARGSSRPSGGSDAVQATGGSSIRYHVESKLAAAKATATATAEVLHAITPAATASPLSAIPVPKLPTNSGHAFPPPIAAFATHGKAAAAPVGIELPQEFRKTVVPAAAAQVAEVRRSSLRPIALALAFALIFALGVWATLTLSGGRTAAAPIAAEPPR